MNNILNHIKIGDLLTHTRCLGGIEEHYFTGMDGNWLCGKATKETIKFGGFKTVNDISTKNITHVNRVPVGNLEFMKGLKE